MMSHDLVELNFTLAADQNGWPPFEVEGLWCRRDGSDFRVLICPLFIKGIAVGDLIAAAVETDPTAPTLMQVLSYEVVRPSDHSTVWMMVPDEELRRSLRNRLDELGCRTEGGPASLRDLVAVDVPSTVTLSALDEILDRYCTDRQIEVVFPTLRHADTED